MVPALLAVSGFDLDGMIVRCLVLSDLTEQRAAEAQMAQAHEELGEQSAFLEQARGSLGLGWWIVDAPPDGRVTASLEARQIFGLANGEFDGQAGTWWAVTHPDDAPRISSAVTAALDDGAPFRVEHRIVGPGRTDRWVLQSAVVERDEAGVPERMLGICQDITDRKRIEAEIGAAAAYNRSLIEASLDPLITIGTDGVITDVNSAAEQACGQPRADLIGTELSSHFTEPALSSQAHQQAFRDGSVRDCALDLRHRDGHTTPVAFNASVYRDPGGRVLGVFAAMRDLTHIKRAESALRESEARLRAIFDNAPVGIDHRTPSGEFVRVNPQFCALTGYTAGELGSLQPERLIHPDDLGADLANTRRLLSGEIDTYTMEKRYLRKGGGVVWAEVSRAMVRDPDGFPLLIVGIARDITEQRQAEAEVRALNAGLEARVHQRTAELQRANRNLEAFTYSVSHDLRAPLRAMSGFSEALLEEFGDALGETGSGYARRIEAASERMATLIDDLLQLSRVSRTAINLGPVNLSAEAAVIAGELRSGDSGRPVRFAIQDGVQVTADRSLIRTVLQNLLENAWKFTAHREDATIEFGTIPGQEAAICCYVRDNGAGFDPAYAGKLFQPFQRLHVASDFPGTGIGLASVRQIVERHEGRVWAEGAVDEGATFYFTLNATPEREPAGGNPARWNPQAGTGTPDIATLTTTTGQGAFRRQARATGPMPSGAHPALPSTSISAPLGVIEQHPCRQAFRDLHGHRAQGCAVNRGGHLGLELFAGVNEIFRVTRGTGVAGVRCHPLRGVLPGPHHVQVCRPQSRFAYRPPQCGQ